MHLSRGAVRCNWCIVRYAIMQRIQIYHYIVPSFKGHDDGMTQLFIEIF